MAVRFSCFNQSLPFDCLCLMSDMHYVYNINMHYVYGTCRINFFFDLHLFCSSLDKFW